MQFVPGHVEFTPFPFDISTIHFEPKSAEQLRWMCKTCRTSNNISFAFCRRCGHQNPTGNVVPRVFFGQLPKDHTAEVADWLITSLFPDIAIYHIEPHTNKDGRSKGCAWVYLHHVEDEHLLLPLHRRALFDMDASRQHGIYIGDTNELERMADAIVTVRHRPMSLPRQLMVVELPVMDQKEKQFKKFITSSPRSAQKHGPLPTVAPPEAKKSIKEKQKEEAKASDRRSGLDTAVVYRHHNPYAFNPIPVEYQSFTTIAC